PARMPAAAIDAVNAYFTIFLPYRSLLPAVHRLPHHGVGRLFVQLGSDPGGVGDIRQNRSAVLASPWLGGLAAVLIHPGDGRLHVVGPDADVRDRRLRVGSGGGDLYEGVAADLD